MKKRDSKWCVSVLFLLDFLLLFFNKKRGVVKKIEAVNEKEARRVVFELKRARERL